LSFKISHLDTSASKVEMLDTDGIPSFPGEDKLKFWPRFYNCLGEILCFRKRKPNSL